jgi:polyphosphate kinase
MTSDRRISGEISKVFKFFKNNYKIPEYEHLIVSPHFTRLKMYQMIDREIENAKNGMRAYIHFKMNSLVDKEMIDKLYEASQGGVEVKLNIRGICSLLPGVEGMSENIEGISILGRYLEHARMYIFANGGDEQIYISSADLMTRNLDTRVEVTCPVYDPKIKAELRANFDLGWSDSVKARKLDETYDNKYRERKSNQKKIISQDALYAYYKSKTD